MGQALQQAQAQAAAAANGGAAGGAAGANGQPQQQQQQGGFNFGSIMRMILLYQVIGYFFRSPAAPPGPDGRPRPPHTNLWPDGQGFDMRMYIADDLHFDPSDADVAALAPRAAIGSLFWELKGLTYDFAPANERAENITLPAPLFEHVAANGSLWAHVYVTKRGYSHLPGDKKYNALATAHRACQLNVHKPKPKVTTNKNLISGEYADDRIKSDADVQTKKNQPIEYVNFWKPVFQPRLVHDHSPYPVGGIPLELKPEIQIEPTTGNYYPPIYFDYFWLLSDRHIQVNESVTKLDLELLFSPIGMMKWRLELQMEQSWKMQESWSAEPMSSETDMFKRMLIESNPYFLGLTMCVSLLHMVFDFLAFKNDIAFWKENKSLEGLSVRTIFINAICQVIIFLYLCDNDTSWMILGSSGIGLVIEFWKIKQACDVQWLGFRWPFVAVKDKTSYTESGTSQYDKEAMRYLSWAVYPLVIGYSVYSLLYQSHKSWYSWVLGSLVGTVYAFGFILMCPQLYLNYKLKSVAHLPWRMLTYKALNTFIDDLFAFVITMPTLHRLSCFRDDIIFFIFLYQKWIYPTDYKRVNEFGYTPKTEEQIAADKAAAANGNANANANAIAAAAAAEPNAADVSANADTSAATGAKAAADKEKAAAASATTSATPSPASADDKTSAPAAPAGATGAAGASGPSKRRARKDA